MRKMLAMALALVLVSSGVRAASDPSSEIVQEELGSDEVAPTPEPPYPGSEDKEFAADPSMIQDDEEESTTRNFAPVAPPPPAERPIRIDDDGYHYATETSSPEVSGHPGIQPPKAANKSGEFFYGTDDPPPAFSGRAGVEKPVSISSKGEYRYHVESSPSRSAMSFRMGSLTPPDITNAKNRQKFTDVYGGSPLPVFFVDYEWRLLSSIGRFSVKFGSGITAGSGQGKFASPTRASEKPDERFTFILFPNQLTAVYKFQYAERQVLVPYVEGGGGYFTFAEIRDDGKKPKLGGAAVGVAAGGVNFLLDWLDPAAIRQLDNEYGINHIWLTVEFRSIVGVNKTLDFTSNSINGGFLMEF